MGTMLRDLRYGLRVLARSRAHTAIAILTLAVGVGATSAVFSVMNAVLLRQPPYQEPDRLVTLRQRFPQIGELWLSTSPAEYIDYRDRARSFSSIAGYESVTFNLTGGSEPLRVEAQRVTHTLFAVLGVSPIAGRGFLESEDKAGAPRVALLSHQFWQRRFGGAANAIGSTILLNEQPHTIVGIMPAGFEFPFTSTSVGEPPAVWVPMAFTEQEIRDRAADFPVHIVARLRPDVSITQAEQDVAGVAAAFQRERSDIYSGHLRLQVALEPLGATAAARVRPTFVTLAGAVVFVLVIACANVMHLQLARGAARQHEMAVRNALGASAGRLVSQLLVEGVLLSMAGAILGLALALLIVKVTAGVAPSFVAGLAEVRPNIAILGFTLGISLLCGLACSLVPALSWLRADVNSYLKQAGRQTGAHVRRRVGSTLVVLEAASAVVLLIGAGLLIHSLVEVLRVPVGFSPDGVLIARTSFNRERYPSDDRRREAQRLMTERLAAIPGVTAVALTTHIPLADERQIGFVLEGDDPTAVRWANNALVSGDYFAAMGIPVLRGRTFGAEDSPAAPVAAIVNDSMARRFWPNGDALGKRLLWGGRQLTIVGVVGDVHIDGLDRTVNPTIYTAVYQVQSGATRNAVFILRTPSDPASITNAARAAIWSVDRDVPVFDIRTMIDVVSRSLGTRRFAVVTISSFAFVALALAMIGLYGVLSHAVVQRRSEFGLRLALGSSPLGLLKLVLEEGMRLTVIGIVIGGVLGVAVARAMSGLLFGIGAFDPLTFGVAIALLLCVALLANLVPARRAARSDPMVALRAE
jgi:putative ABC transport system permease protein